MSSFLTGDRVSYTGQNRPWLLNCDGKVVSTNASKSSFLVDFRHKVTGRLYSEWVGAAALKKVQAVEVSEHAEVISNLDKQLQDLRNEMTEINTRLGALLSKEAKLVSAISALKKL